MQRFTAFQQIGGNAGGRNFVTRGGSGAAGGGRGMGFRPVAGEIIKADDTSITVKLQDGSSKIVGAKAYQSVTIRNANTTNKLAELCK
jgi:hypothetical protein